jgi:hypothetical protein
MAKNKYIVGNYKLRVGCGISGKGLFATEPIPKGACIIEYTGKIVKKADQENSRG